MASRVASGVLVFATLSGLALADGGGAPVVWGVAALWLLWLVAAAVLFARQCRLARLEVVMLACLGLLLAWTGVSAVWSVDPEASIRELERGLVGLAGLTALLLLAGGGAAVLAGVVAAGTLTALIALAAGAPEPVGYANALGLLSAMGAILALGFATRRGVRALALAAAAVQLAAVFASGSAGAPVALALGAIVAAGLSGGRRRVAVVAIAAATAATIPVLVVGRGVDSPVVGAAAPVAGDEPAAHRDPSMSVSVTARLRFWVVAARSAADAPLHGTGAGSFARTWLERRPVARRATNAHNLYLETFAELGLPGALLLVGAVGAPLVAASRARQHPLVPAAAGAYSAFLAHAAIDVDWETPVVTLAALACAGAILIMARRMHAHVNAPLPPAARAGALVVVVLAAAFSMVTLAGNAAVERGRVALRASAFAEVRQYARDAARWAPWSAEPWRLLGEAADARGDRGSAREHFMRGVERDPGSWALWRGVARTTHGPEARRAAARSAALNPFGGR